MKHSRSSLHHLKNFPKIVPNSDEWENLEYNLRLAFGSTTVSLKSAWCIANPNLAVKFGRRKEGEILDSWIETSCLDENNDFEKVLERGFHFPKSGLIFPTGNISLTAQYRKSDLIELMLVRINVKNPLGILSITNDFVSEKGKLPSEFDCIYLLNDLEEKNKIHDPEFKNNYILFEDDQALPMFVVQIYFDSEKEKTLETTLCYLCQKKVAIVYCKTEEADLCNECSANHHNKLGKLASRHILMHIKNKPANSEMCLFHPQSSYEYFCPQDYESLCVYCKINGSHSQGNKANHKIIGISDAYQKILDETETPDQLLEKKKERLIEQLISADERMKLINDNSKHVEDQIYEVLKAALHQLHEQTFYKLSLILSERIEIRRQINEISWLQTFLRYQRDLLGPATFLKTWPRYVNCRDQILHRQDISVKEVYPDLKLHGSLIISTDESNSQNESELRQTDRNFDYDRQQVYSPLKNQSLLESKRKEKFIKSLINSSLKVIDKKIFFSEKDNRKNRLHSLSGVERLKTEDDFHENIFLDYAIFNKERLVDRNSMNDYLKSDECSKFPLSKFAEVKYHEIKQKYGDVFLDKIFQESDILRRQESKILYCNLPIRVDSPQRPILIWKKNKFTDDILCIEDIFKGKCTDNPSILLFQYKKEIFGSFIAQPLNINQRKNGHNDCVLFNLSKDSLIILKDHLSQKEPNSKEDNGKDSKIDNCFKNIIQEIQYHYLSEYGISYSESKPYLIGSDEYFVPDFMEIYILVPDTKFFE